TVTRRTTTTMIDGKKTKHNRKGVHVVKKKLADGTYKLYYYNRETAAPTLQTRHAGTFVELIRNYLNSIEFETKLRESTKVEYRRHLTIAEREFGSMPVEVLNDPRVRQDFLGWRDKLIQGGSGVRQADYHLQVIGSLLSWARDRGIINVHQLL